MKFVLFQKSQSDHPLPGLLTERGIIDASGVLPASAAPQATMQAIIDSYQQRKPDFQELAASAAATPLEAVKILSPLPRPGKILCCIGNYWEHAQREARPLNMFLKNPDAVIGPGDTIVLPEFTEPYVFQHEAELGIVASGPAKSVKQSAWRKAVFGYTGMIDVSARAERR